MVEKDYVLLFDLPRRALTRRGAGLLAGCVLEPSR